MSWVKKTSSDNGEKAAKPSSSEKRLAAAVDFAYTLNHAIVCTATDPITDVPIGVAVQKLLGSHKLGDGQKTSWKDFTPKSIAGGLKDTFSDKKALIQWTAGEFAGDFGAVPFTVALRQFAPGTVETIGKIFAPIAAPVFKRSTARTARKEFAANGLDVDSPECAARAKELFDSEMKHLPNAVLWTVLSPSINIFTQKVLLPKSLRNDGPTSHLVAGKIIGSTVTSSLTVGLRSMNPKAAQKWDNTVTEKVSVPVLNIVSGIFGVDKIQLKAGVESMHKKTQEQEKPLGSAGSSAWEQRMAQQKSASEKNASLSQ